ncbi:Serine/threonine-protein kinase [Nymphaea thermarum]|nr:Serine/threonine-protein kinase [Nymphaea thermarum]
MDLVLGVYVRDEHLRDIKIIEAIDRLQAKWKQDEIATCSKVEQDTTTMKEPLLPRSFTPQCMVKPKEGGNGTSESLLNRLQRKAMREIGDTNEVVAVKRFSKGSSQGKKEYVAEVTVISRLRHRNLLRLIGWCHERGEFLLVYEYMEGRSLDSRLFSKKDCAVLPWAQRRKVVLGLASVVLYLHEEWEQCVIHRDIKLSNVMVDSEFNARLGDFGLARLTNHGFTARTTMVAGTRGYLSPECVITGKASTRSDKYSYGVVLLEIATSRRAIRPIGEKEEPLVQWIWDLYGVNSLMAAIDERLGSEFDQQEMERMMVVGLWCVHPDPEMRPTIREAIRTLSFQGGIPSLPQKMPVPVYASPPMNGFSCSFTSSSAGTMATTPSSTTVSSAESAVAALMWSQGQG